MLTVPGDTPAKTEIAPTDEHVPPDRAEPTPSASPPDPLAHLEHPPAQAPDGRGARIKRPSCYVQHVLAGEGTPSGCPTGDKLPPGVPRASTVEVCEVKDDTAHFTSIASTPAGVEPKNEAEAHTSPDWPNGTMPCAKKSGNWKPRAPGNLSARHPMPTSSAVGRHTI